MLDRQIYKIAIWSNKVGIFTNKPHECIAHLQTSIPNGQYRWSVVQHVWGDIIVELLDMDVCNVFRPRSTISSVESNSTSSL